jgi:tetraacyldisaccharide 4'-kinase
MREPDFWNSATPAAKTCAALLSPIGALYGLTVRLRETRARPYRAKAQVICIGNLTAGGSGKTPVAMTIAGLLEPFGKTVFLTRGYGGRSPGPIVVDPLRHSAADTGDEPLLLTQCAPTIVARNRAAGARLADSMGAGFIVMDDGFQNFSVAKDLPILLVDARTGFGNGKLLPAGPLRESVPSGLNRARAIILVGNGTPRIPPFDGPILRADLIPETPEWIRGRKIMAFAGIGRPQKFFHMLECYGAELVDTKAFPDHHRFSPAEITGMKRHASDAAAQLVTTSKDHVRLDPAARNGIVPVAIRAVFNDPATVQSLLSSIVGEREAVRDDR